MKISRPYPGKKIVELRCTNQFLDNIWYIPAVACQMHIVQSETLATPKTVNM